LPHLGTTHDLRRSKGRPEFDQSPYLSWLFAHEPVDDPRASRRLAKPLHRLGEFSIAGSASLRRFRVAGSGELL
jgi:hypothetical protein